MAGTTQSKVGKIGRGASGAVSWSDLRVSMVETIERIGAGAPASVRQALKVAAWDVVEELAGGVRDSWELLEAFVSEVACELAPFVDGVDGGSLWEEVVGLIAGKSLWEPHARGAARSPGMSASIGYRTDAAMDYG